MESWSMWMIQVVSLLSIFSLVFTRGFCPIGCECDETGVKVRCLGAGITMVPILLSPGLKKLYLSYNMITSIADAFEFYEWLQDLDLSHNSLTKLGENNFEQQLELKELRLSHNNISRISKDALKGLYGLHFLDLSHNKLVELPPGFLSDSSKIKILLLSNNNILTMAAKTFRGLRSLRVLDLCSNLLRRVPGASLEAVSNTLETLQMCRNRLKTIEPDDFPTPFLKTLSLESNFITLIDPLAFSLLSRLQSLNLNNNLLNDIPTRSFSSLLNIHYLHLSRNNITVIKDSAFKSLTRLSHLEVSRCPNLESVYPLAFSRSVNLNTLKLSHNEKLRHIPDQLLSDLPLTTLEMRANDLSTLCDKCLPLRSLQSLDLRDNPFVCNCSLLWLLRALHSKNNSLLLPDVVCSSPDNLRGIYLSTVPTSQLFCLDQLQLVVSLVVIGLALSLLSILACLLYRDRRRFSGWKSGKKFGL